jgi:Polyketide cyclase / dehydrase and lipid transport
VTRIAVGIDIDAPPERVWRVIERLEDYVGWMHDATAVRFLTGQIRGVGTGMAVVTKVGPLRLTDQMTITEWDEPRTMGVAHTGVVTGTGRFTLRPCPPTATRFEWEENLRFPLWLGGRIGATVAKPVLAAIWRRNLRDLKHLVEGRAALTRRGG